MNRDGTLLCDRLAPTGLSHGRVMAGLQGIIAARVAGRRVDRQARHTYMAQTFARPTLKRKQQGERR